ncbi:hypothetical protein SAY86_001842 [Trapa natans]|uniref:Uncharacterized protein n=1 Tax=Trapa natans TaxID=22666 RepID=A0AAN7LN23_TRANT|nr:hypothetical protein SAY86_001842 [Trapa natans]
MSAQLTLGFWRGRIQNRDPILRWSWLCFTRDSRLVPAQMSTRRFTPTSSWSPLITSHDKARVNTSAGEAVNTTDRRTVDFHPSVWGDYFIEYTSSRDKSYSKRTESCPLEDRQLDKDAGCSVQGWRPLHAFGDEAHGYYIVSTRSSLLNSHCTWLDQ